MTTSISRPRGAFRAISVAVGIAAVTLISGCSTLEAIVGVAADVLVAMDSVQSDRSQTGVVAGGAINSYTITFQSHERVSLQVRGDGTTDLDCYVYSTDGSLLVKDDDDTDQCILDTSYTGPGQVTLHIVNRGSASNRYVLSKRG